MSTVLSFLISIAILRTAAACISKNKIILSLITQIAGAEFDAQLRIDKQFKTARRREINGVIEVKCGAIFLSCF